MPLSIPNIFCALCLSFFSVHHHLFLSVSRLEDQSRQAGGWFWCEHKNWHCCGIWRMGICLLHTNEEDQKGTEREKEGDSFIRALKSISLWRQTGKVWQSIFAFAF